MPVLPTEETAPPNLTEAVAKNPSSSTDSTASEHPAHDNEHTPGGEKASAQDMISKGPQVPKTMEEMPPKASKEEMRRRAEELNQ